MNHPKQYYCYILVSQKNGTLYVGVTSDLVRRIYEHKNELIEGFSQKYGARQLVWFEEHSDIETAILREKQIKKWNRAWKLRLIEAENPQWVDLYSGLLGEDDGLDSRLRGNDSLESQLTV